MFDVVSEETLEGTVKEAALPPRGYNQLPTSGVLSYQDGEAEEQLIPYGLGDLKVCCALIMEQQVPYGPPDLSLGLCRKAMSPAVGVVWTRTI